MKHIICLAHGLSLSLFSIISIAADNSEAKMLTTSPVNTGAMLETLLGLVLVLACIAFLAWLLRRTGRFNSTASGEMKIIAGLSLGPRERAILLQVGEKQILVGVTAQQIQTLHVLEQPINTSKEQTNTTSFAERLQQILQQRGQS
ncbi:MAG: flagellar biosynthetic protein FliO [Gammaproteobacteria bacterium]|nr:MAG: flagellar biosynthetic protein FliO [Gammaproteobacteria bacterium]